MSKKKEMKFSINDFWKNRISTESIGEVSLVEGWSQAASQETFAEAPMSLE